MAKSQAEFAKVLGVQRNTVARYEAGRTAPSPWILLRLYDLAGDSEKETFASELKRQIGTTILGREATVDATIEELRPLLDQMTMESLIVRLPKGREKAELYDFAAAVASVLHGPPKVDESIVEILKLWGKHGGNKKAVKRFRDAATFLRVHLLRSRPFLPG